MYLWAEKMAHNREQAASPSRKKRQKPPQPSTHSPLPPCMELNQNHSHHRRPSRSTSRSPRHSTAIPMAQSESDEPVDLIMKPDRPSGIERTAGKHPSNSGTRIMLNIIRALAARGLFIVHSMATIWITCDVRKEQEIWAFALISVSILIEGCYAIIMRAGDERKWFSPSVLLYVLATAPPIWLLESTMCEWRIQTHGVQHYDKMYLQLMEQLLLVVLIVGRWLLPKGQISREQLSQILLAYLAMSSDIVEFFDVFKEKPVYSDKFVQYLVLSAWTLSLLQFPFVLTMSRARKMRVCTTSDEMFTKKRTNVWQALYDIDLWAILLANCLQDIPFLLVRLYLLIERGLFTYTMAFFISKNFLIIALQTYRAFVLFNDRYMHTGDSSELEATAAELYHKQARRHVHRKPRKSNADVEKMPIYNNNSSSNRRPSAQQTYGTNRSPHRHVYRQVRSSIDEE